MSREIDISIIIPCYKCESSIPELNDRLHSVLAGMGVVFEIIYINDHSPDDDWSVIRRIAKSSGCVVGINFSKNFGQHHAITAGIDCCRGKWVVVMDGDLQDRPEEIVNFYKMAQQGYDAVVGIRKDRRDSLLKKMESILFYAIYNYLAGAHIKNSIGNFGIYSRNLIESIKKMREQNRSFGLFALWVGFNRIEIDIEHSSRKYGKTSYNFYKLANLAFDSIITHSNKLLYLTVMGGFIVSGIAFFFVFLLVILKILGVVSFPGWTSAIASIYLMGGLVISAVGIVGIYVGKVFDETKKRPLYLISESINLEKWPEL